MPAQHILSFARDLSGGGVERALLRLVGAWTRTRRVTLVLGRAEGPLRAELPGEVELIDLGVANIARLALALPDVACRTQPDLIFCPGSDYTSSAAWTRLRLGRATPPIVAKQSNAVRRGDHGPLQDRAHLAWLAVHGRFLDHMVAMTPALAAEAGHAMGMAGRVSVIPNPPLTSNSPPALPPLPERFILGVGRLVPQKRWDRLLGALPALAGIALVLAGEGPDRAALIGQAARLGVTDRVHLLGHVTDPLPLMARAAVLALTSDFEGAPGVLGEALSVGTPVVATDSSPAVQELVHRPALGRVIARDDPAALVEALRHWLDPDTPRPPPQPRPGADSADRYLSLFDALVARRP
jgi:glycosyltransferase involved in cell wall biosynthesis